MQGRLRQSQVIMSAGEPETAAEASESKRPRAKQCTDLQPIILGLAKLQEDSNKLCFITYGDSSEDPQKAKLIVRGPSGVEGNLQFLKIVGQTALGKAKIKQVLAGMVKESKIKFSSGKEKKQWTDTMCNRWRCLSRVISLACAKEKPAAWTRMLPWIEGGDTLPDEDSQFEDDFHEEMQDRLGDETISIDGDSSECEAASQEEGDEQSAEEEEITEKKNAEENADAAEQAPEGQQYLAESQETPIAEKATIKVDDGEAAADSTFDFKFSTELMLPLRLKKNEKKASWEPGRLLKGSEEDALAVGEWPDGVQGTLSVTVKWIADLQRTSGGGGVTPEKFWTGMHSETNHSIYVDQRIDRHLLMSIYEQSKQICQHRVDSFGEVDDGKKGCQTPTQQFSELVTL